MVETLAAPLFWLYLLALTQTAAFFYSRVSLHQKSPRAVLWVTLPFIVLAAWATIRLWGAWDFRLRGWNGALGLPEKAWFVLCLGVAGGLGLSRLFWRWRILRKADARRKAFRSVGTGSRPPLGFLQSIGIRNQVYDLTVSEYELWLDGWPEEWSGLSITHLTDIHHGRFFGEAYLRQARREALALKSDLLAWTGDFVSSRADYAGAFDWMRGMRAPLGAWAVLGNHEGWAGRAWALESRGGPRASQPVQGLLAKGEEARPDGGRGSLDRRAKSLVPSPGVSWRRRAGSPGPPAGPVRSRQILAGPPSTFRALPRRPGVSSGLGGPGGAFPIRGPIRLGLLPRG